MILPIALAWILVSRAKAVTKILVAYASVMFLGGIAVSLSRGGWVAVSVSLAALFGVLLFHRNYRLPAYNPGKSTRRESSRRKEDI